MISITKSPGSSAFSGNPMIYDVSSNDFVISAGTIAEVRLNFGGIDTVSGHSFNLFYDGKDHVFFTIMYPGWSGYGIPTANTGEHFNDYVARVYDCMIANYDLKTNYHIELHEAGEINRIIHITAKEVGSRWDITLKDITMDHLTQSTKIDGEDRVLKTNFAIIASIWDAQMIKVGEDLKGVNALGKVSFDFSDYFKTFFETILSSDPTPKFEFPEVSFDPFVVHPLFVIPYVVSFAEKSKGQVGKLVFDDPKYCLNGGLNREAISYYNSLGSDYFSNAENKFRFLSTSPVEKVTGKFQVEKLYFHFVDDSDYYFFKIAVKVTFSDSTSSSFYATETSAFSGKSILEIQTGYTRLDIGNVDPSKVVVKWEVWLENNMSQPISEIRTFILDDRILEYERTFIFKNSLGGYEVARFIGEGETSLDNKRTSISVQDFNPYTFSNPPNKTLDAWETQNFTVNTGWISQQQNNSFRDLLLTTECYEILDDLLFPVVITSTKIKSFEKDGEYLFNLEVEYERAYNDHFFTANFKPVNMITTEDLTQGVGVIFEASEEITYFGYPKFGTTSEADATWRIKKIEKVYVSGKPKYIVKWADGNLNYDNMFSNCQSISYAFLSS